jgi:hypothetical protein
MSAADFWASICFFVLGVYMAVSGLRMPGAGGLIEKGGEPGRVPFLLGVVIAVLAVGLLFRSVMAGGYRLSAIRTEDETERAGLWRCAVTAVGCSVYAVGLVGAKFAGWHVPYGGATALFVFAFIVISEWSLAAEHGAKRWQSLTRSWPTLAANVALIGRPLPPAWKPFAWLMVNAAVMAVVVSAVVTIVFERYFFVTLP